MSGLQAAMAQSENSIGKSPSAVTPPPAQAQPAANKQPDTTQKVAEAPKPEDTTPKKPWERLEGDAPEKKPAEKEKAVTTEDDEIPEPPGMNKAQKDKFIAHRQEHSRLKKQVPELQGQLDKMRQELEQARSTKGPDEATLKELEELRTFKAASDVQSTPEWDNTIRQPIAKVLSSLGKIAEKAGVDAKALEAATDAQESWERAIAIREVFEKAADSVPEALVAAAINEAEKLWPLYAQADKMKAEAQEVWKGLQNRDEVGRQQTQQARQEQYLKHHTNIFEQLKAKLPAILGDEKLAKEIMDARPSDDPDDQAYSVIAGHMLPVMATKIKELTAEVVRLQKSEKALVGGRAGISSASANGHANGKEQHSNEFDEGGLLAAISSSGIRR